MAMPKNSIHFIAVNQADSPSESNNQEVKSHDSSLVEVPASSVSVTASRYDALT